MNSAYLQRVGKGRQGREENGIQKGRKVIRNLKKKRTLEDSDAAGTPTTPREKIFID
jgi:hypothetical protein